MHPLSRLLQDRLPQIDVGVMRHGFAEHGRDYVLILQNLFGPAPGTYKLTFTHVVQLNYATRVTESAWRLSWTDDFIDYGRWQAAGEPDGYVFGANWSLAYPGFSAIDNDPEAASWSKRLKIQMYAAAVETDLFKIFFIFHDARLEKINEDTSVTSQVITPLPPS